MEACWHACVARLSGAPEVVLGATVSGRTHAEIRDAVGPYAQILPLRTRVDADTTLAEVVDQVRRWRGLAERWQEYATRELLETAGEHCTVGFASVAEAGTDELPVRALLGSPVPLSLELRFSVDGAELHYDPVVFE